MPSRNRRLAKGLSWALSLTDVKQALGDDYRLVLQTEFPRHRRVGVPLSVTWLAPGTVHPDVVGIHIDVGVVPAAERAFIRSLLCSEGLPRLRQWVRQTQVAAETWKAARHLAHWVCEDEALRFHGDWPR